jgi:hypothetical protein
MPETLVLAFDGKQPHPCSQTRDYSSVVSNGIDFGAGNPHRLVADL